MPPTSAAAAKLFHPKQKKGELAKHSVSTKPAAKRSPAPPKPSPPQPATPEPTPASSATRLPDGPYTEFKLVSSAVNGWKYDVMRFESRKPVDILSWERPVKLNRKDTRRGDPGTVSVEEGQVAVKPMLGPDGKPVIGADGRIVMLDAEGKPIHNNAPNGKQKQGGAGGRKKIQKKTKQVFKVSEPVRQLRKEERYPWVMEDASGSEVWVAAVEEVQKSQTHAFFMPASNNTFKFVPAHRWYKFQKKPKHTIPSLDEAEKLMSTITRNKDPSRWMLRRNNQANDSTLALFKQEGDAGSSDTNRSLGPGGRRLRVKQEDDLFGDNDESGRRPRNDMDADYDEVPYEEEFQDDDEKIGLYEDDELTKEMEERLHKEYLSANKTRDGQVDESDEEEPEQKLTGAGKSMKKLVGRHEKNEAYESDEEENPYASEQEESESEEEEIITNEPAVQAQPARSQSRAPSQPPSGQPAQPPPSTPRPTSSGSPPGSRATSPAPVQSGHSLVAKRATSPKAPKPKPVANASRAGSPLAQDTRGAGNSPTPSAPPTPRQAGGSLPTANGQPSSNKRKAEDAGIPSTSSSSLGAGPSTSTGNTNTDGRPPPAKKRRAAVDANGNPIKLTDQMVIDWLRTTENATTRDCITYFTPFLRDKTAKDNFTKLIREVASLKGGVLALRPQFRFGTNVRATTRMDTTP